MSKAPLYTQYNEHSFPKGVSASYAGYLEKMGDITQALQQKSLPLLALPTQTDDMAQLELVAACIRERFKTLIVLGTGGSGLNGLTLVNLTMHLPEKVTILFMDNIDPFTFTHVLAHTDYASTAFLCISKSGNTVETLSQTCICIEACIKALGNGALKDRFFFITDPAASPMRHIGDNLGSVIINHSDVGGRYSALTSVGLLPAMVRGLSGSAFRRGAASVIEDLSLRQAQSEPAKGAALAMALMEHGYHTTVMMPYLDRLSGFSSWFRQLWAESLGKNGKGSTPIRAIGTVDQHSQLQLYLDGPQNKSFTFITLDSRGLGPVIDTSIIGDDSLAYVQGKNLGDLMTAEQQATMETLILKACPVRHMVLSAVDESVMGALMMHFMLETVLTAALLEVNPFDQPAVEAGKVLTRELLRGK